MAKCREMNQTAWDEWISTKPPVIQEMCALLPPDRLYLLKTSGRRVTLTSYAENRTVTVAVTGEYNALMFEREVFGIKPENLEECDLPADGELLGVILTERKDVEAFIDAVRPLVLADSKGPNAAIKRVP